MKTKPSANPSPWHHSQGKCPPVLGITLHRPWSWAFFGRTFRSREWPLEPGLKDVENRKAQFPEVPPGTWLALHNGTHWDKGAEIIIKNRLPSTNSFRTKDCPAGVIVGVVRVAEVTRAVLTPTKRTSRWRLPWETAIWLEDERHLLPQAIPCPRGWFNAWKLPDPVLHELFKQLGPTMGIP